MLKFRHQVRKNNYCIQKYHFKSIEVGRFNSLNPYLKTNQTNESKPDKSFKKIGLLKRDKNIKKKRKKKQQVTLGTRITYLQASGVKKPCQQAI